MYKKIISIITLVTTTFAKCPMGVTLPDKTMTEVKIDDDTMINQLESSLLASVSRQGGVTEIANKIDSKNNVGEAVMGRIAEYVPSGYHD